MTAERANKGILVTTSYFTQSAVNFAEGKPIELVDGEILNGLLNKYELLNIDLNNLYISTHQQEYQILENALASNSKNHIAHYKIVALLLDDLLNADIYDESRVSIIISKCKKHLLSLKKLTNANDVYSCLVGYVSTYLYGFLDLLTGDFFNALDSFYSVLKWDLLKTQKCIASFYYDVWHNAIQVSRVLGLDADVYKLQNQHQYISEITQSYFEFCFRHIEENKNCEDEEFEFLRLQTLENHLIYKNMMKSASFSVGTIGNIIAAGTSETLFDEDSLGCFMDSSAGATSYIHYFINDNLDTLCFYRDFLSNSSANGKASPYKDYEELCLAKQIGIEMFNEQIKISTVTRFKEKVEHDRKKAELLL